MAGRVSTLLITLVMSIPAIGQTPPRAAVPQAEKFMDKSFGYAFTPPVGSTPMPHKQILPDGQLQLAAFISTEAGSILTIRHARADQPIQEEQLLDAVVTEALARQPNADLVDKAFRTIANLPGATCSLKFASKDHDQLRRKAVVLAKANEVFIITFDTLAGDPETTGDIFNQVLDSFEIIHSKMSGKTIEQALQRGVKFLADLKDADVSSKLVPESHWRFDNKGRHVGFVRVKERHKAKSGLPGIEIEEKAWFFSEENTLKQLHNTIFLSTDMTRESWENIMEMQAERPEGIARTHQLLKGLRQADKLAMAYTKNAGDLTLTNEVLEISPSYISAALIRIFPRLVDLKTPQTYAFASYQSDTRALVLRTFRVVGPDRIDGLNHTGPVYKIEDSEGMVPPVSEIYVDKDGRILRIVAGDLVMIATQWKEVELIYKERMAWADRLVQRANQQVIQQFQAPPAAGTAPRTNAQPNR
jgi:hypothetical protein